MALDKVIDSTQLDNDLTAIADSIRAKSGTAESLNFPNGFVSAIDSLATGGGDTEAIEQMIDESGVLDSTEGTVEEKVEQLVEFAGFKEALLYRFYSYTSVDNCFLRMGIKKLPRLDFSEKTVLQSCFRETPFFEGYEYYINSGKCTNASNAFQSTPMFKYLKGIDLSAATAVGGMFNASGIETIEEPINFSKISSASTSTAFNGASKLKEIRFFCECIFYSITFGSSYLSAESIQSIIDGLAYVETAQTLTLHKNIVVTDEQKATINTKGWTLAQ